MARAKNMYIYLSECFLVPFVRHLCSPVRKGHTNGVGLDIPVSSGVLAQRLQRPVMNVVGCWGLIKCPEAQLQRGVPHGARVRVPGTSRDISVRGSGGGGGGVKGCSVPPGQLVAVTSSMEQSPS
jgi:hypothetical protein